MEDKAKIRKLYLQKRKQLTDKERSIYSDEIYHQLFNKFDFNNKIVSLFLPINKFKEINTYPIFDRLTKSNNTTVGLSVSNTIKSSMELKKWSEDIIIKENEWGIPEPTHGDIIENKDIDIVIVPMLICDRKGHRIGYGKGFYDRFLATCKKEAIFIGLNYFTPITSILKDKNDIPLHYLVTPQEIYSFVDDNLKVTFYVE